MNLKNEDGYDLWLRYRPLNNAERLAQYRTAIKSVVMVGTDATLEVAKNELAQALPALLNNPIPLAEKIDGGAVVIGTIKALATAGVAASPEKLGTDGFAIQSRSNN
jgi:alpha-glucuronidase